MSISVTMAYYNRPKLLQNTLWAYRHLHALKEHEFIIVDDVSDPELSAEKAVEKFTPYMNIKIITLTGPKVSKNPARAINIGVRNASYDTVIITNPECMPITPVLEEISVPEKSFVVVPCYSIDEKTQETINNIPPKINSFVDIVKNLVPIINKPMSYEGEGSWYEHPIIIPRYYYFLAAMRKKDFIDIGGIDEDFMNGIAYEDDDFKRRLITNNFSLTHLKDSLCFHQNHYKKSSERDGLWRINAVLYRNKKELIANKEREWGVC